MTSFRVLKAKAQGFCPQDDWVAVEEPLEVQVTLETEAVATTHNIAVTMRTPGHDLELALGFLMSEGLLRHRSDINLTRTETEAEDADCNRITIVLQPHVVFDPEKLSRHVFTSSSCGVCGKLTKESIVQKAPKHPPSHHTYPPSLLYDLPRQLREHQANFEQTGGLHACAYFDENGRISQVFEDVGRHNALDKLVGAHLLHDTLPQGNAGVLLSGRISFELIQKAALAGFSVVAAIGAPSSLAVALAADLNMTLIGFLKTNSMNIYTGGHRIQTVCRQSEHHGP